MTLRGSQMIMKRLKDNKRSLTKVGTFITGFLAAKQGVTGVNRRQVNMTL